MTDAHMPDEVFDDVMRLLPGEKEVGPEGRPSEDAVPHRDESDRRETIPIVLDFPQIGGKPGRPKKHPGELCAGGGHHCASTRAMLTWLGNCTAHCGAEHGAWKRSW